MDVKIGKFLLCCINYAANVFSSFLPDTLEHRLITYEKKLISGYAAGIRQYFHTENLPVDQDLK